jgi:hypothetical protein
VHGHTHFSLTHTLAMLNSQESQSTNVGGALPPLSTTGDAPTQQSVFVYVQGGRTSDKDHYDNNYPSRIIGGLAITQIVVAFIAALSQVRTKRDS